MNAAAIQRSRSLKVVFGWWFAATLLTLYGVIAAAVYLNTRSSAQRDIQLIVKSEAETVASYIGSTGRLDPPELAEPERSPFTIWIRLIGDGKLVAATPGVPDLPILPHLRSADSSTTSHWLRGEDHLLVVQHDVGGQRPDLLVEAVGRIGPALEAQRRVRNGLLLGGLVVIPIAAFGGRLLAARAMRSVDSLVSAIRKLDSERLADRLVLAGPTVDEVAVLTGAFNDLLSRLEASVETRRRFTADASHEIRNPLTILLAFARQEPGLETPIVRERLDFSHLVTESAASFEEMAAERRVGIACRIEPGLEVLGDEGLLRLIGFNLIDNALKHSPDGSAVEISLTPQAGLDRFFRNEPTGATNAVGGLGLSVVRWVSETHGGSVRLLDQSPGAAFEVLLPLASPQDRAAS